MSEDVDAWDAEDFDPDAGFSKPGESEDTWEGEDEGLKIEEEEEVKSKVTATVQKKSKQQRIEEKKAKRREEELKSKDINKVSALSPEDQLEEKQKAEEALKAADLQSRRNPQGFYRPNVP